MNEEQTYDGPVIIPAGYLIELISEISLERRKELAEKYAEEILELAEMYRIEEKGNDVTDATRNIGR